MTYEKSPLIECRVVGFFYKKTFLGIPVSEKVF
jgi:hypothetical protein